MSVKNRRRIQGILIAIAVVLPVIEDPTPMKCAAVVLFSVALAMFRPELK